MGTESPTALPVDGEHDALGLDAIRRVLRTTDVGFHMLLYHEVDSTTDVASRLAGAGAPEGTVVLAEAQRAGRGRLGQPWFSPAGVNLHVSVLFRPAIAAEAVPIFALAAPLAVSDAIRMQGAPAGVRWPNDVVLDGRKAAGTFVRWAGAGDVVDHVVLGAAVDLNVGRPALAAALGRAARGVTSVREATGRPVDRNRFAADVLTRLEQWVQTYRRRGPGVVLRAWRSRDALAGRLVLVRTASETCRGRALGVNSLGGLVLETAPGVIRAVTGGELVLEA